jgi:hypothetical protein
MVVSWLLARNGIIKFIPNFFARNDKNSLKYLNLFPTCPMMQSATQLPISSNYVMVVDWPLAGNGIIQ